MTTSTIKKFIRYNFVKSIVAKATEDNNISSYPVNVIDVFKNLHNCRVISYSTHMEKYNLTPEEVISYFGSEEGCTIYNAKKDKYLVFYNDLDSYYKPLPRIRWTLTHELGHILLGHLKEIDDIKIFRNSLSEKEYENLESEANNFTALFLANPVILDKIDIESSADIEVICKLSVEASKYRYNHYLRWRETKKINKYDKVVLNCFNNFISKRVCATCGNMFFDNNADYCIICGDNKLYWGDGNMIYNSIKITENSKAKICPICNNERTDIEGEYCQICGTHIVNKCTNEYCGELLEGDARYCPKCGSPSVFLQQNILTKWDGKKFNVNLDDLLNKNTPVDDGDMPF